MTPLHEIGDFIRSLLLAVPMPVVRGLFILVPLALLVWILFLPKSRTSPLTTPQASPETSPEASRESSQETFQEASPPDTRERWWKNLKIWAALALLIQIVIYALF